MTLPAGTVDDFTGSLAEQIEAAFAGELYAVKQARLPDAGKAERRILFCAIAQATLAFLAANPGGLELDLTFTSGFASGGTVAVQAPTLTAVNGFCPNRPARRRRIDQRDVRGRRHRGGRCA
jgi:hypothetical protein